MNRETQLQIVELVDALQRNVNDNFINVSFEFTRKGKIYIRIILKTITEKEKEYIDDLSAEFEASQNEDLAIIQKLDITTNIKKKPYEHVVYNNIELSPYRYPLWQTR